MAVGEHSGTRATAVSSAVEPSYSCPELPPTCFLTEESSSDAILLVPSERATRRLRAAERETSEHKLVLTCRTMIFPSNPYEALGLITYVDKPSRPIA
jgi:hypothetical protein